ncbi:MAG: tetratricopeptide repeat protein [Planctomycetota bacterium]|nr:tetratricopeptide repeat protein [Planctomycetota bacterium]
MSRKANDTLTRFARAAAALALLALAGCGDSIRTAVPFLPPSEYVDVGGRKLTRAEVAYYQKVREFSQWTRVDPNDAVAYYSLGELFQAKGNYELAKELYVKSTQLDPTLSEAHHNLGVILIAEENYNDALTMLDRAVKLSPDDAKIYRDFARAHEGLGHYREALESYDRALGLDPEFTSCYLDKARMLYGRRRYKDAEAACRQALTHLSLNPVHAQARVTHGTVLDKILPESLLYWNQERRPEDTTAAEATYDLALCLKAQGRLREALTELVPAEKVGLGRADVLILKSRLLEGLGDLNGAISVMELLRPQYPAMAEIPKQLSRLYQKAGQAQKSGEMRLLAADLDHSDRALQLEAVRVAEAGKDTARAIAIYERLVRTDPEDIKALHALAEAYDRAGIRRQAALAYQELVNRRPDDLNARRRLGFLYADLPGFQGRAVLQFKRVLQARNDDHEVHRRLGELYTAAKNLEGAEEHVRWSLELNKSDPVALAALGSIYAGQNRPEEAIGVYRKALQLKPDDAPTQLLLAMVLLKIDRKDDAVQAFEAYLKLKPDDAEARRNYANTLRDLNRREDAVKEYQTIIAANPRDVPTAMELAKLSKLLGQFQQAAGMYEALLEANPSNREALRQAGRLYDETKQPMRAMFCWQRLIKLAPKDLEAQKSLAAIYKSIGDDAAAIEKYEALGNSGDEEGWRNAAFLHLKRGDRVKAIAAYRKVIEIKRRDVPSRRRLAALLQRSEDPAEREEALQLYKELIQLDPKDAGARLNLANLYTEDNRLAQALEQFEAIQKDDEKNVSAHVGLGVVYRKWKKYKKSEEEYGKALELAPNDRHVHYNVAVLYDFYLDEPDKARQHYNRFLELGGDPVLLPKESQERLAPPSEARPAEAEAAPPGKGEPPAKPVAADTVPAPAAR